MLFAIKPHGIATSSGTSGVSATLNLNINKINSAKITFFPIALLVITGSQSETSEELSILPAN